MGSSNTIFRFKQFAINQDRTAMKVGTDGVLLGALAPVGTCRRVLDIGTGTGLVALMIAQRQPSSLVTAVELDHMAADQARENIATSPFSDRVAVVEGDAQAYTASEPFDLIVSNPPYFEESLLCPDSKRTVARHSVGLTFEALTQCVGRNLARGGHFAVIIPALAEQRMVDATQSVGLTLGRKVVVFSNKRKPARRVVLTFQFGETINCCVSELTLLNSDGSTTPEYKGLCHDFYLDK